MFPYHLVEKSVFIGTLCLALSWAWSFPWVRLQDKKKLYFTTKILPKLKVTIRHMLIIKSPDKD